MVAIRRFPSSGGRVDAQAARIWMALVAWVEMSKRRSKKPVTLTYGELAEMIGYSNPRAMHTLGRQLGIVATLCIQNDLPALNSVVVAKATGLPGPEVLLRSGKTIEQEQAAVWDEDWFLIRVPAVGMFREVWREMGREDDEGKSGN